MENRKLLRKFFDMISTNYNKIAKTFYKIHEKKLQKRNYLKLIKKIDHHITIKYHKPNNNK